MFHARPTNDDHDFHRSQADFMASIWEGEQDFLTLPVLEDICGSIDSLLADSACINPVILDVIISGCSCIRDLAS